MALGDGAHDVQTQAGALDARREWAGDAVEAFEDPLELALLNAGAAIAHADGDVLAADTFGLDGDLRLVAGVLHGVVDQVGDGGADLVEIAADGGFGTGAEVQRLGRHAVQGARAGQALLHDGVQIEARDVELGRGRPGAAGSQHLLDGGQQTIAVLQHDLVELVALVFVDGPGLQGFQIQADGGDGSFQFVRDGVDEGVVLFVPADLAHQEDGVQHDAGDDDGDQQDAESEQNSGAPVEQYPADVENQDDEDEAGAQRDEERDGFAAARHHHASSL